MRTLTCIVCPLGCALTVTEKEQGEMVVFGNRCSQGVTYAIEETTDPKRVVTATCRLGPAKTSVEPNGQDGLLHRIRRHGLCDPRRVPVKTTAHCPKAYIDELLRELHKIEVLPPVKQGAVILKDWKGLGIDVVATRSLD